MKQKSMILKVVISGIAVLLLFLTAYFVINNARSKGDGSIYFVVYNLEGEKIIDEEIFYNDGMTLLEVLLEAGIDLEYSGLDEMAYVTKINGLDTDVIVGDKAYFLALFINDEMAMYGIAQLPFKDQDRIMYRFEEDLWG